jgi:AbrB family looped-hinge helix DNA binding protein
MDGIEGRLVATVTVSPTFEIVIPPEIRQALRLHPGQQMMVIQCSNHIVLVPIRPIEEALGSLKGIDTTIEREPDRF